MSLRGRRQSASCSQLNLHIAACCRPLLHSMPTCPPHISPLTTRQVVLGLPIVPSAGNLDFWLRLCGVRGLPEAQALLRSFPQADAEGVDKAAHAAAVREWNADLIRRVRGRMGERGIRLVCLVGLAVLGSCRPASLPSLPLLLSCATCAMILRRPLTAPP